MVTGCLEKQLLLWAHSMHTLLHYHDIRSTYFKECTNYKEKDRVSNGWIVDGVVGRETLRPPPDWIGFVVLLRRLVTYNDASYCINISSVLLRCMNVQ